MGYLQEAECPPSMSIPPAMQSELEDLKLGLTIGARDGNWKETLKWELRDHGHGNWSKGPG